ncbi:MAG TPA: protein kinase, partial [Planctomycetaceae bacterium]|nr:protein kinase [Planctomycetaceae bacterium]
MNGNLQTNTCDADRLESYLNGELSEMQELEFTAHLDQCEACRSSLELRAADPESWSEAEQLLKPLRLGAEHLVPPRSQAPQIQQVLDALAPTDDPAMLGRLGGYEVSGVVGAGGMGVVLKAVDKSLDRTVAIKVMSPHLATSGAARKRFAREAKAAAAVLHPNVIAIHSVSNDETLPYLVMPYVRGAALQKRLDAEGPLALNEILRIGSQIAAGLSAAHAQGLVHRDIKPANILLEDGIERVAITDFGLARAVDDATITRSGVIAGTPQYMSPEQARGESIDQRSDLFSLGSVLYAICTGRPPFRAETTFGVMRRITDDEPKSIREINPDIPDWLCVIIKRLMSKRAADRFASAEEVQELLEQCLAHVQQPDSVPLPESLVPQPSGVGSFFRSHRTGVIAMLGAFGFSLLGMLFWQGTEPPDIAGTWTGDEWGTVVLEEKRPGQYEGTYTETVKDTPGTIRVRWSRIERRYNGTWSEGDDRFGKISVRLVDDEIRGGWTTNRKSEINPGTPELANLSWKRTDTSKPLASMTEIVADSAIPTVQELIASVVEVDLQRAPNASGMRFEKGSVVVLTGLITRKKDLQLRGFELQRMELMDKPAEPGPARSWDTLEIQDSIKVLQEAIDLEIDRLPAELMDSAVTSPLPRLKQGEWPDAVVHPQLRNTLKALNDPPEDTVQLRYLDFDVKPNCFYRYRVRLEYNNPDYDMTVDQLSDQTISSDWSKPTKLVPKSAPENQRTDHGKRSLEDTSKQLDGLWRVVESQKGSSADFTGKRKTLSPKGIDFLEFRASAPMPNVSTIRIEECMTDLLHIEIDPQTDPPSIDVVWFHKAFGEQGQILQDESELISIGIFEATEDELKILLVPYNSALTKDQRPKSFSLNGNLTGALYRLKRYVAPPERQEITGRWNVVSAIHDGRNITEEFEEGILSFSSLTFAAQSKPNFVARSWGYYQLTTDSHPAEITFITHDYGFWKGPMGREPSEQFEKKPDWNGIYRFETKDGDAIPHNASNSAEREQPKPSRLRIAFRSGGPRPESFKSEPDSGVTLLELERQPNREQENLATYPEQYKRLIEQRQYKTAAELALEARELAPDESARQLWSLKSKFAKQLEQTEAGSGEEQELRELLKFPLHPIVDPQVPHVVSPPTPIEVIRELERNQGL